MRHAAYGTMPRAMSVLTRDAILGEIERGRLAITPFSRDQVGAASIDLTLGDEIRVIAPSGDSIEILNDADYRDHTRVVSLAQPFLLQPGTAVLGITRERIGLPSDLCG
ncbi:MAG: hypothetical protein V3T33_03940, partial [Myxococcota bacterium]